MRTVGCNEIANDPRLLAKTLSFFETIQQSATPAGVIFPWLPTPAKLKRTYAGGALYIIFQGIVNERKKTGKREEDALQFMIDQGDDVIKIIGVSNQSVFRLKRPLTNENQATTPGSTDAQTRAQNRTHIADAVIFKPGTFPCIPGSTDSGWKAIPTPADTSSSTRCSSPNDRAESRLQASTRAAAARFSPTASSSQRGRRFRKPAG